MITNRRRLLVGLLGGGSAVLAPALASIPMPGRRLRDLVDTATLDAQGISDKVRDMLIEAGTEVVFVDPDSGDEIVKVRA